MNPGRQVSLPERGSGEVVFVDVDLLVIGAERSRTIGQEDGIEQLAASIAEVGVLQPLLVRPNGTKGNGESYTVIAGHRRRCAAAMVGLSRVPCIVCDVDPGEAFLLSLVENLQRNSLHPLDEAWAYDQMIENGTARNRADIARRLGVSRARVTQRMKLLDLDEETKLKLVKYAATLSEYHARLLLKVRNLDARHHLAETAGRRALSGRELRAMIEDLEEQRSLEAWQQAKHTTGSLRSYQVTFPGLRLSVNLALVDRARGAETLRRVAAVLEGGALEPEATIPDARSPVAS